MRQPLRLGDALGSALKGLHLEQRKRESSAMALWPDIVGDVVAGKTRPLYVSRGTLHVAVTSSVWASQLHLLKPQLLAELAQRCGPGVITDIRCKVGQGDGVTLDAPVEQRPKRAESTANPPLSDAERERMQRLTAPIADAELADAVSRALVAFARRRERRRAEGWVACKRCGVLHPPGDVLCPPCFNEIGRFMSPEP